MLNYLAEVSEFSKLCGDLKPKRHHCSFWARVKRQILAVPIHARVMHFVSVSSTCAQGQRALWNSKSSFKMPPFFLISGNEPNLPLDHEVLFLQNG